jgi:hypothetical protein
MTPYNLNSGGRKLVTLMTVKASYSTPMLHVADIERSIRFYALLGFATVDTDCGQPLGWARLHHEGGALMFLRAEHPVDASAQALMLCMYTPDLAGLREHLLANGVERMIANALLQRRSLAASSVARSVEARSPRLLSVA